MKRFYISIIFVTLALIICITGSLTVSKMVDDINNDLEIIVKAAKQEDYSVAKQESKKLAEKWNKYQNYLIVFINMNRIDEISEKVFSVTDYCTKESKDHLNATLSEIVFLITDIKDAEKFSLFLFL